MPEPSQNREDLRETIRRISSRPPPDICQSEDNIPTIEYPSVKDTIRFTLITITIVSILFFSIIAAIAWQTGYFK
jgi:hypothetical protein